MIVQKNLYLPGQDLTNLAQNVDYNRYQDFKGNITVNFGTVPATVTVKVGTILEVNGNLYAIETADYVFSMDNATHNYLTFTDNPGIDFGSAAAIGTYTAAKQGYYQAGNLIRTLPFYIDQTNSEVSRLMDEPLTGINPIFISYPRVKTFSRISVYMNANQNMGGEAKINFDREVYDILSEWDTANYIFTALESGWYIIGINTTAESTSTTGAWKFDQIRLYHNANAFDSYIINAVYYGGSFVGSGSAANIRFVQAGETICFKCVSTMNTSSVLYATYSGVISTAAYIHRIL